MLKPQAPKDIVPPSCDLCNAKEKLEFISVKEEFVDGGIKHYMGWVCHICAEDYENTVVARFKRDNPIN